MKKTTKIVAFMVTVIICFATLLSSCHANTVKQTHTTFDYFDTVSTLTVYTDKKSFEKYKEIFESVAQKYHELFDIYNEHDGVFGLYELNRTIGEHEISSELMDFLKEARRMHDLTGGHTNIAMGNVTSIWHETRERANASPNDASLPHMSALESASEHTDISALKLNTVKMTVERLDTEMSLDAGALGKGYTADRIAEALTDAGCESFLINLDRKEIKQHNACHKPKFIAPPRTHCSALYNPHSDMYNKRCQTQQYQKPYKFFVIIGAEFKR